MDEKQEARGRAIAKIVSDTLRLDVLPKFREKALADARKGKWSTLANYLEQGGRVTPQIRLFLIEVLSFKVKQPRRKERKMSGKDIALEVFRAELRGEKNALDGRGRSPRQVHRYVKEWRPLIDSVTRLLEDMDRRVPQKEIDYLCRSTRYVAQKTEQYFGHLGLTTPEREMLPLEPDDIS
jgi:hypothetical protein